MESGAAKGNLPHHSGPGIKRSLGNMATSIPPSVALFAILVATALVYLPVLFQWFWTDDVLFLHAFREAGTLAYLGDAFDIRNAPPVPEVRFYRPLHATVFLGLSKLFGLQPAGYHLWSLCLHLLNVGLVWLVAVRLTKRHLIAAISAAVFAFHPAYTEAIAWISNNNALMATAVSLLSLWCFLAYEEGKLRAWLMASVVFYGCGLLLHPEIGTLPVVLFGYRAFVSLPKLGSVRRLSAWIDLTPFALVAVGYALVHNWMVSQDFLPQAQGYVLSLHMVKVYLGYIGFALYPYPERLLAMESIRNILPALALALAMAVLAVISLTRQRPYIGAFAICWFLAALLPLTTIGAGLGQLVMGDVFGRKLYVAGPSLAFMLAVLATAIVDALSGIDWKGVRVVMIALALGLFLVAAGAVVRRADQISFRGQESEAFVGQLRERYPVIQPGTSLYLIGAPPHIRLLGARSSPYVSNMIGLYYDDVTIIFQNEAPPTLREDELVFEFEP